MRTLTHTLNWPGLVFVLALLGLWQIAAGQVDSTNFPGPLAVLAALTSGAGMLISQMQHTLWRAAAGFLLALLTMLPLGLVIGRVAAARTVLGPVIELLRPIPPLAIVPIAMLFAGIGSEAKILVIFYSASFPLLIYAIDATQATHPALLNTARSLGLSRAAIIRHIDLPASLPMVMVGIRLSVSMALLISVASEMLLSSNGIGFVVTSAQEQFRIAEGIAAIVFIGVVALLINWLLRRIESWLLAWHIGLTTSAH
ncbi:MAG: ABC transporter permease [Pigmentiphaga sp.]|nr:ABC transporter permease [Pigmentiphaga sp.]